MARLRVTVEDVEAGTKEVPNNNYFLLTTGRCYVSSTNASPGTGTHVLTIRSVGGVRGKHKSNKEEHR